jgi:hypothetical protein
MMITRLILPAGVSAVGAEAIVGVNIEAGIGDGVHVSVGNEISVCDSVDVGNNVAVLSRADCFSPHKLGDGAHECMKIETVNRTTAFFE